MNRRTAMIIALVIFWALFLWSLFTSQPAVYTGLLGLAAGVITGQSFPSRRAIVRETK